MEQRAALFDCQDEHAFSVALPDDCLFKARPATEGDHRFVYCEPSNENWDAQNERVLQKALAESAPHFLKFGNIDIDHLSLLGPRHGLTPAEAKLYEIGVPAQVVTEPKILVKAEIYRGDGKQVEQANYFWDTLTKQSPPKRWYPSVGGRPTAPKECGPKGCVVKSVLWTNLAFAKEPVNQTVKAVSLMGFDAFAKAIAAGYGTDSAQLSGGAALRRESLHGATVETAQPDYKAAAGRVLTAIRKPGTAQCAHFDSPPTVASLVAHFEQCERADPATARAHAARLILEAKQHARQARHSAALAA